MKKKKKSLTDPFKRYGIHGIHGKKQSRQHASKITWLDWSNMAKLYSVNSQKISLSVSGKQASRQASAGSGVFLSQNFRYFPAF